MRKLPLVAALLVALCTSAGAVAQPPSAGPMARNPEAGGLVLRAYGPDAYNAGPQNWAVVQDSRGILYVGNASGVLIYDGVTWRKIFTPGRQTIRSLAVDAHDRVWVGAIGDFGYLDTDPAGETKYISLLDKVPAGTPAFADVWRTFATPDGVFFQAQTALFRWSHGQMKIWHPSPQQTFNRAQLADGIVYLGQTGGPLMAVHGDRLDPVPGADAIGTEPFPVILRLDATHLLMGTTARGLFLYDGRSLTPFPTEADARIEEGGLYRGFLLPSGSLVLTTRTAGVAIIDREGHLLQTIGKEDGLRSPAVYYAMEDREGGLWLALDVGLARVEAQSPVSVFGPQQGLEAAPADIMRHDGTLYVATGQGVELLRTMPTSRPSFEPVSGIPNEQAWAFAETAGSGVGGRQLLVTTSNGVYAIHGTSGSTVLRGSARQIGGYVLSRSTLNGNRIWFGRFDGMSSLRWSGTAWIDEGPLPGFSDQVQTFAETPDGTIWVATTGNTIYRIRGADAPGDARGATPQVSRFDAAQGVPRGGAFVSMVDHQPFFETISGGLRYDEAARRFVPDKVFDVVPPNADAGLLAVQQAQDGRVYVTSGDQSAVLTPRKAGGYDVDRRMFTEYPIAFTTGFYAEPDGVLWFTSRRGFFVRFDTRAIRQTQPAFAALVRRVTANGNAPLPLAGATSSLPASTHAIRFDFAAPSFMDEAHTEYQSTLAGFDRGWSDWSRETHRDYMNLPAGRYSFHVHARNQLGQISDEAVYQFGLLPPWYRTWWAYTGYAASGLLLLALLGSIQRGRVVARERQRAEVAEARLRAESAEALAKSEHARNQNIETLSEAGREITSSLEFETIFDKLYERVQQLAEVDVFGVGLYHPDREEIEYRLAVEQGQRYTPYSRSTRDPDQFAVWCVEHREPVFVNDVARESTKYIAHYADAPRTLADGTFSRPVQALIYLPLLVKDRVLGVMTIQSYRAAAYSERHLNMMQSLAAFTAIALDNANAYRQINDQEHENRRLFEEAQRARAAAEDADAAKSAFLSTVSHELRTPLTSVLGFAKIIKKRLDDRIFPLVPTGDRKIEQTVQQVQENLQVVVSEGERLTKLIDDVLDLAKIEAGKLEWHMEPVAMQDVIDHATAATASLFDQKPLTLVKDVDPTLPLIQGDRDRLIQVVINLISNAVKFTPSGSVTCRARRSGNSLVVSVIDTGVGIAPADQPKVFERFKQVGDTLTDKPKGTGLGLPICREIVEHHGGHVWVESEPDKGSTFSFELPVGDAHPTLPLDLTSVVRQLRDQVVVTTPRSTDRQSRILVVDDEEHIRSLLTQEFTDAGYAVTTAANGREALAEVRRQRPDLVVLDVMMPDMNGFDVAAVLRNDPATHDLPIIILSIVQDRERGFRLGVDRYLTKPIDTDLLFREVGALLAQRTSHKRILVVDEDASTVRTLTDVLTARGYQVTDARREDVREKATALQPDIIMVSSTDSEHELLQALKFEKGMEHVLFVVYR